MRALLLDLVDYSNLWISFASLRAALFRLGFLFPMFLRAQLTAFFTKFRLSVAPFFINGNNVMNFSSSVFFN